MNIQKIGKTYQKELTKVNANIKLSCEGPIYHFFNKILNNYGAESVLRSFETFKKNGHYKNLDVKTKTIVDKCVKISKEIISIKDDVVKWRLDKKNFDEPKLKI